ncbi:MAG: branched-chain amino acid transport system substrate-binding protein [Bradyrhizobium sp.]|nr:branched-chain amino acid transport system substrate-binding protein [Bradyrhizobium sp.]
MFAPATSLFAFASRAVFFAALLLPWAATPTPAAEPIKIGLGIALTGGIAPIGKQLLVGLEIWRDDLNAKGGLLGRPVELIHYDDQSNPGLVPAIYTKLLSVDKVDLLLGPYGTNMISAALPVIMPQNKMTIGILGVNVNQQFNYSRYFVMIPGGDEGVLSYSRGWFETAMAQTPKPKTVAIVAVDGEFGQIACGGARDNAKASRLSVVYDRGYPPASTDLTPVVHAIAATKPDLIFVCAYPPDTVAFVRAAAETNLNARMLGGPMIGMLSSTIKMQLGPLLNGFVFLENFPPSPKLDFPGLKEVLAKYRAKAPSLGIDLLGYGNVPFAYAAGQVLAKAVVDTQSLDHAKLADYIHATSFRTVLGELAFGRSGEWKKSRTFVSQFQNVTGNDLSQFRDTTRQVVLWPAEYETGTVIYPYQDAKKK